jgi:hypothetical protein
MDCGAGGAICQETFAAAQTVSLTATPDPSTGAFTWQPGAGFIGDYDFVFVAEGRRGVVSRHEVRVTLRPREK